MNPSRLCSQNMQAAFQHYQSVTKNISLPLRVEKENDILKAKIVKALIVSHCRNGRVHVIAWRNTPTHHPLLSVTTSPPGAQTWTCTTGVNSVNCRKSWTGITLNPCGTSQTKAGDAYVKQCRQQCLEWSRATKANYQFMLRFSAGACYWIFSSRKTKIQMTCHYLAFLILLQFTRTRRPQVAGYRNRHCIQNIPAELSNGRNLMPTKKAHWYF